MSKLINPEKDYDREITDKVLYRYESEQDSYWMSFASYKIVLKTLQILKETPKGYWVRDRHYWKKWVSKDGRKRFAYSTKEDALFNFLKRKEKQQKILKARLDEVNQLLRQIDKVKEENKTERINNLKKELSELRQSNKDNWMTYGSELCAGDMISKENKLEEEIRLLENGE